MVTEIIRFASSDQQDHVHPGFCGPLHCPKPTIHPPNNLCPISSVNYEKNKIKNV